MKQNRRVLNKQNIGNVPQGKSEINKFKPPSEKLLEPRKRPVFRIGFEIHPYEIEGRVSWVNMDVNIHLGDVGAFTALRVTGDSYILGRVERVLKYVPKKFPGATGMVYAAPSWPLYFLDPSNGTYPSLSEQLYTHVNDSKAVKVRARVVRNDENNKLGIEIKVLEEGNPLLIPHRQVLTHSLANPQFTELPEREQLMWALSKAILSTPFVVELLEKADVNHVYRFSWVIKKRRNGLEVVRSPDEMIPSKRTVFKNISSFSAGGGSVEEVEIPFPTSREEALELAKEKVIGGGTEYYIISPFLPFPEEAVLRLEHSLKSITNGAEILKPGEYAYHVRPLHDPYTFEVFGMTLKLTQYNREGINNSSKGVSTILIVWDEEGNIKGAYALLPIGQISRFKDFKDTSVQKVEIEVHEVPLDKFKEIVDHYKQAGKETAEKMRICTEEFTSMFEKQGVYGVWEEYKKDFSSESTSMLTNYHLTRRNGEKIKDLYGVKKT